MSFHNPQTPTSPSQSSPTMSDPMTSMTSMPSTSVTLPTPEHSVITQASELMHEDVADDFKSSKRKRSVDDDASEREQKKVHIADDEVAMDSLHLDVGDLYSVCQTPHSVAFPPLAEDLFEMFGLNEIAAEYARVLPNGEKNAIRKTYKGHIKRLAVNGHFDAVKVDENGPDTLLGMMCFPEEEWNIHFVRNKELDRGLSAETRAKLPKAMGMSKGLIPKQVWDSSVLGELSPLNTIKAEKAEKSNLSGKLTTPGTPIPAATAAANVAQGASSRPRPQQGLVQEATRPKRSVNKRSYRDSSFEGYGEGYLDDELGGEGGYSTGEADNGGGAMAKRRKKNPGSAQQYTSLRQNYGPGMVGA